MVSCVENDRWGCGAGGQTALWPKEETNDHLGEHGLLALWQQREDEWSRCPLGEVAVLIKGPFLGRERLGHGWGQCKKVNRGKKSHIRREKKEGSLTGLRHIFIKQAGGGEERIVLASLTPLSLILAPEKWGEGSCCNSSASPQCCSRF